MDLITPAEYARHAGISKPAVSKAIANGTIPVYSPAGERIGPDAVGKKLVNAAEADRARGQARVRINVEADEAVSVATTAEAPPAAAADAPRADGTLTRARTESEEHRAQLLRLELEQRQGRLVAVEAVEAALVAAGEAIVRQVDQLPAEVDDLAAAFARGGVPAGRQLLKDIARRMRERIADALTVSGDGGPGEEDEGGDAPRS